MAEGHKKRARGPLSPCDPGQNRKTLQPIAAIGGVFDDGVRLHEVRIDGADEARTVRGEAFELLHGAGGQVRADEERGTRRAAGGGRHEARQA